MSERTVARRILIKRKVNGIKILSTSGVLYPVPLDYLEGHGTLTRGPRAQDLLTVISNL